MKVGIIGAGAAGLMAAVQFKYTEYEVVILDHSPAAGKKLIITGNGRCNLTNMDMSMDKYYSTNPERLANLMPISPALLREYLDKQYIYTYEKNGYVYPMSNQASSVLKLLLRTIEQSSNIKLKLNQTIRDIRISDVICVTLDNGYEYVFDKVILACGGMSYSKTGSDGSILEIIKKLGISYRPYEPALVPIKVDSPLLKYCSKVRCKVGIRKTPDGDYISRGELQINSDNLSGIVIYDISRNYKNGGYLYIDFLPDMSYEKATEALVDPYAIYGLVNDKLAGYMLEYEDCCSRILKNYQVRVVGVEDVEVGQVSAGGIVLDEITDSYESVRYPGLYMVGEMLDVDGICGGYNLHFAFNGAIMAARDIKVKS
ncbi:MAG: aminoacetone oxidase family FAD-binding enzyme [Lachnospiraceae bacterium]|nr:aminoacetone oxidase family FAD-binding enzyme [Lachnospiraceae bacterium]